MRFAVAVLTGALVTLFIVGCGSGSGQDADKSGKAVDEGRAVAEALTVGHWRVQVTVRPSRLGPIAFAAKNLARAKRTDSHPWVQHDLVFRNTGDQPVTLDDTRSSTFIGEAGHDRLLAADEGCGYSLNYPGAPATAGACFADLRVATVKPHTSAKQSVTLFKGLRGMDPLVAGTYVFRHPVGLQFGVRPPSDEEGRSGVAKLVYQVEEPPG
jgi:hypothetical protein